jgi:two-component system, NtrC family, response regulator GlrR
VPRARIAVITADVDTTLSRALALALRQVGCDFTLSAPPRARADAANDALADAEAAVVVAENDALADALRTIAELRIGRPALTLLAAAAAGHDAQALGALLAAGACDLVQAPLSAHELGARLCHRVTTGAPSAMPPPAAPPAAAPPAPPLPPSAAAQDERLAHLVGGSAAFRRQVERLPMLAGCDAGVLILGETGTGKELFAQAVHYLSRRAAGPWVALNCGAVPVELFEAELFGHVRGAFTSAMAARAGLVREADGGTLFLDEVDALPLAAQVKLLRFVQEKEFRTVGANALQHADVRVIAASNCRLPERVAAGTFRQDLYFRLNVLAVELPPLRERHEDIVPLAQHFLAHGARALGRRIDALAPAALQRLLAHHWPGNVRELQHVIERALLLCPGPTVGAEHIEIDGVPDVAGASADRLSFQDAKRELVAQFERSYIERLLRNTSGNITHAAAAAGKNRRAFFQLMRKHRIDSRHFRLPH